MNATAQIPTEVVNTTDLQVGDAVKVGNGFWFVERIERDGKVSFFNIDQARVLPVRVRIANREN